MDGLDLDLPSPYAEFVDEQVASGSYASIGDYLTALVKADARAKAQERLEAELLQGLEGEATEWTDADAERLKQLATNGVAAA